MDVGRGWFEHWDLLLFAGGVALLMITLGRRLLERAHVNTSWIYLALGLLAGPAALDVAPRDFNDAIPVLRRVAEMTVVIGLIVLGIRVGRPLSWRGWQSTVRLILLVKPGSIVCVTLLAMLLFGLPPGPALLLGAVLAPTDPILAGPLEEESADDDAEDRFGLSSEAGVNDGFAFPFVFLGLYLTRAPAAWREWGTVWLLGDLLYGVGFALPAGWLLGAACGRLFHRLVLRDDVSHKRRLFVPHALLLFVYGLVEALGAYGFLAVFAAGLAFRRELHQTDVLDRFAHFTESVDELMKAAVLVMVGALMPWAAMPELGWPLLVFVLAVFLLVRPALVLAATARGGFRREHRLLWAWFGIRGIGGIFYISYALDHGVPDAVAGPLFAITLATVLASVLLHGVTLRPLLRRLEGADEIED